MSDRKELFPVWLDLSDKKIFVIGTMPEIRQILKALECCCGTLIWIVDQNMEEPCFAEVPEHVQIKQKPYEREDLLDADLVFCGTKDQQTAEDISAACRCLGIPVYLSGNASKSSFCLRLEENES